MRHARTLRPALAGLLAGAALALPVVAQEAVATDAAAAQVETALDAVGAWRADPLVILDAAEVDLADFQWIARPVVVFANSPLDPAFAEQMEAIAVEGDRLAERDVVVIVDTDPAARSAIRTKLRPRGFMLALIAKDGQVNLRKPIPWTVRELSRSIDKMPIRQREIRDRPRVAADG